MTRATMPSMSEMMELNRATAHLDPSNAPYTPEKGVTGVTGRYSADSGRYPLVTGDVTSVTMKLVQDFCERYIAYPNDDYAPIHALWIAHTWIAHELQSTPRLAVISPEKRSGKTRLQEVTELLCAEPIRTIDVSAAYLFRKLDRPEGEPLPTILLDEADALFFGKPTESSEDLRRIFNAGYRRGAFVGRCEIHAKEVDTKDYPVFAPVCLAGIGDLPDTIMDRAVIFRMKRRNPNTVLAPFRFRKAKAEAKPLRSELEKWSKGAASKLSTLGYDKYPELPESIQDRDADVWEPLFITAMLTGGDWPDIVADIAPRMVKDSHSEPQSLGERLLRDIRDVFDQHHADAMFRLPLLGELKQIDGAPWATLGKDDQGIDSNYLTKTLKRYDIPKARTVVIDGARNWGWHRDDFEDAWQRYLPPAQTEPGNAGNTNGNA